MGEFHVCYLVILIFCYASHGIFQFIDNDELVDSEFSMHFYDDTTASQNGTTETPKHLENLNGLPNTFAVRSHKKQRKSCNNDTLQKIMRKNIQDNPRASKRAIYHAAFEVLSIGLNVVCARCSFSFLTKTTLYCQEAVKDITCFAYKDG